MGELCVDGPTVMLGYWGLAPQTGAYRTGDMCVLRSDGNYELRGRRDQMVKYRGHRLELGEVERTLGAHADVQEVAAAVVGDGIDRRLIAVVVPRPQRRPTLLGLKRFAAAHLPRYMRPDLTHEWDALPRTPNGKIDRIAIARRLEEHSLD